MLTKDVLLLQDNALVQRPWFDVFDKKSTIHRIYSHDSPNSINKKRVKARKNSMYTWTVCLLPGHEKNYTLSYLCYTCRAQLDTSL